MSNYFNRKKTRIKYGNLRDNARPNRSLYTTLGQTLQEDSDDDETTVLFVRNDTTENEALKLRDRTSAINERPKQSLFVDKDVREGDTLVGLALRYGCTVAELKRVNNLISNQEFHALSKVKIPIRPYSVVTEMNDEEASASASNDPDSNQDARKDSHIRTLTIGESLLSGPTEAFLRHMDEDLERIRKATCQYKASLEEVAAELTCKRFHPLAQNNGTRGIQLCSVLCIGALIVLIIPVVIIVYTELTKKNS